MSGHLYPGLNLGPNHPAADQQAQIKVFGLWVFLMSDLIIFGLLFATYIIMLPFTAGGPGPRDLFNLDSVAIQTALLLISSLCMGMAMLTLKYRGTCKTLIWWLAATAALGVAFLYFELSDFMASAAKGGVPSRSGWLSSYFSLVGFHGIHVTAGVAWIVMMIAKLATFPVSTEGADAVATRLLRLSVFWHFLDIVWIFIFSVVYLMGVL